MAGFAHVRVSLPPPQRHSEASERLSATTRKALRKLFAAVGLAGNGSGSGGAAGGLQFDDDDDDAGPLSLAAFLPGATEALRQAEAARDDPSVRASQLRGALRLGRQLVVGFPLDCDLTPIARVAMLQRLASLLDALPSLSLSGLRVQLGVPGPSCVDTAGQLCLSAHEGDGDWASLLTQVDVPFVLGRLHYVAAMKSLQQAVATAAGLQAVFSPAQHLTEVSYRAFLERLADAAGTSGAVGGGRYGGQGGVALCVLPPHARHAESACPMGMALGDAGYALDPKTGVLHIVDDMGAADVYALVERLGEAALAAARVAASHSDGEAERLLRVRRALRLRRLSKDPVLSTRHFIDACKRLLERRDDLAHVVEGSSLRIAFANRLSPDGTCIDVAHNFED
ncbi:hypothetical protein FOA52_006853 [Chlamydomonas sp. UWO 241]|nr:hypothetical protein FOA52_006853 [Chlamydomonas sp. UWO 241]